MVINLLLVAGGGALGAMLRYGLSLWLENPQAVFPWATWWVNLCGCLCAGIFFAISQHYPILQNEMRLFLMVGILGGFTTFSSFGLETFQLLQHGQIMLALVYAFSSLILGVCLLALGYVMTQYLC